jgi:AcrR family transcriptional regulator
VARSAEPSIGRDVTGSPRFRYRCRVAAPDRRTPRTQGQRTADSRQLILDAALDGLYLDGYRRTTTVTIQDRAGVSVAGDRRHTGS